MLKEQITNHVQRNKKAYLIGSHVVVVGVTILVMRKMPPIRIINNIMPVFNNNNSSNVVNLGGYTTKMVERLSDGKIWKKVGDAAKEAGVSDSFMSRHVNGWEPNVYGETYKIIGVGTVG